MSLFDQGMNLIRNQLLNRESVPAIYRRGESSVQLKLLRGDNTTFLCHVDDLAIDGQTIKPQSGDLFEIVDGDDRLYYQAAPSPDGPVYTLDPTRRLLRIYARLDEQTEAIEVKPEDSQIITQATFEPITVATAKAQSRILQDEEDSLVEMYIEAARRHIERVTGWVLGKSTVRDSFDLFASRLGLAVPNVIEITSVTYVNSLGSTVTLDASDYDVATSFDHAYVYPTDGWPDDLADVDYPAIRVTYDAGFATATEIPADLRLATAMYAGHCFENREGSEDDPEQFKKLLAPYLK